MALALSKFQHMAPDSGPRVQASLLEYAHFGDARLGMGTIVIAGTAGAVANHGSHQPSFHPSNDAWKARLLMHLIIGRFIEPASLGENLRFLQLDSGPDPDFGRLTSAHHPHEIPLSFWHRLVTVTFFPEKSPTTPNGNLQLQAMQVAFHMIQR